MDIVGFSGIDGKIIEIALRGELDLETVSVFLKQNVKSGVRNMFWNCLGYRNLDDTKIYNELMCRGISIMEQLNNGKNPREFTTMVSSL